MFEHHSQCLNTIRNVLRVRITGCRYAGRTAQISFPGESHGDTNYKVTKGMNEFPQAIAKKLPGGVVNPHHRCTDVEKTKNGYRVSLMKREGTNSPPPNVSPFEPIFFVL